MRRYEHALLAGTEANVSALLTSAERDTVHYARTFVKHGVQAADFQRREHLQHFPTLSRGDLQTSYYDVFSARVQPRDVDEGWLGVTSGSTGEPVRFFMDGESIHFFSAFIRYLWRRHQCGRLPLPWQTGVVLLCTLPRSSIYETRLPLFGGAVFRKLHWREPDAERSLAALNPQVITGDPASLQCLIDSDVSVRPKLVLSSAFALPAELAVKLRERTGATVVDYYSLAETGPLAWRSNDGPFEMLKAAGVIESVDGEIVVTNVRNRLFPLIRYRTGDLGEVDGTTITRFCGRRAERFVDRRGKRVDPSQLQPLLSKLPVAQFRLEQRARGEAVLSVYGVRERIEESLIATTQSALAALLDEPVNVAIDVRSEAIVRSGEKPIVYKSHV